MLTHGLDRSLGGRRRSSFRPCACAGLGALAIALAAPAFAQDKPAADDEIIVTAQRREERLQQVPISITSLGGETLRQANVQQLSDIVKLTPAIRFDYTSDFVQPTIRGIGNSVVSAGAGSNVGIYVDGFYNPNPLAGDFQLLNLKNIQVLKGPQGTLFGRNTTGGAILVTSSTPSHATQAVVEGSYGRFNTAGIKGYATTGLTDNIAVDIAANYKRSDGFVHNIIPGPRNPGRLEDWSVRAGVLIDLSDAVSLLGRYTHQNMNDATNETWATLRQDGVTYAPLQNTPLQLPASLVPTGYRDVAVNNESQPTFKYKADIYQLTGKADLGFADLTSYTQYRREKSEVYSDLDQTGADLSFQLVTVTDKTFSQELLMTSKPGSRLQWTTGVFYFDYKDRFDPIIVGPNRSFNPTYYTVGTNARVRSLAGYADATYNIGDHLFVTAGLRYSHDKFDRGSFRFAPFPPTQFASQSGDSLTPRAVVRYEFDPRSSVYASFTRGYKAGLVDVVSGGAKVKPEKINAYEVGYKYGTPRLSFNVAGWYYDYSQLQVSVFDQGLARILNAASARIFGVEGSVNYKIVRGLQVNASAAYVNGDYRSFKNAARFVECTDAATCGTTYGQYNLVTTDASGDQLQRAPRFTSTLGGRYDFAFSGGTASLSGNLYHTSRIYFDAVEQFRQNGYDLLGLRAEWTNKSDHLTLAVYGDNVTGAKYLNQVIAHSPGIGAVWAAPATWAVSARIKW